MDHITSPPGLATLEAICINTISLLLPIERARATGSLYPRLEIKIYLKKIRRIRLITPKAPILLSFIISRVVSLSLLEKKPSAVSDRPSK